MERIPEPELMIDPEQVIAYGMADFEEPHSNFIKILKRFCPDPESISTILDMGCGAGDITQRLGRAFQNAGIDAIDGSPQMLEFVLGVMEGSDELGGRIRFIHTTVQEFRPDRKYDLIASNSLLHHIQDPSHFWNALVRVSSPGTRVFVMDLIRPDTADEARRLVELYSPNELEILKRDFYNSLLAAFELDEVRQQLVEAGLGYFNTERASDRHIIVYGICE
ncbi:MAG: class I SAM-dependent methyltransferase [Thermodesulfobacteriota bacterium]